MYRCALGSLPLLSSAHFFSHVKMKCFNNLCWEWKSHWNWGMWKQKQEQTYGTSLLCDTGPGKSCGVERMFCSAWENAKWHILSRVHISGTKERRKLCETLISTLGLFLCQSYLKANKGQNQQLNPFLAQTKTDTYIKLIFCPGSKSKRTYLV